MRLPPAGRGGAPGVLGLRGGGRREAGEIGRAERGAGGVRARVRLLLLGPLRGVKK